MTFKKQVIGLGLALLLTPALGLAQGGLNQEKIGTISAYDKASRMVTVKGEDWEEKAKVSDAVAKDKAALLKAGTKVKLTYEHRSGGDLKVEIIEPR